MKKLYRIAVSLTLAVVILTVLAIPVLAIADPDTAPQVNAVYVYEFDDGSAGVLIDYYLDYAVLPTETATESYIAVFVDTDGTTQLKAVAPYTYVDSGYGRGLIYIPFTAAEVTTYSLDSVDQALYRIWLVGNPTLTWVPGPDPPKTVATIDQWNTTGDMNVLLALRVLYYADVLELAWSLDVIESTALGNRLTTIGEQYFTNVILNCRTLAPAAFATGTQTPSKEDIDYSTEFGATATSGTTLLAVSPDTLSAGANTLNTAGGVIPGTITLTLTAGTYGTIQDGTGSISSSPSDLVPGVNTITVTGAGTLTVTVNLQTPQQTATDEVTGTGFDLTTIAARFGMSRMVFSGLVWLLLTIIICGAVYGFGKDQWSTGGTGNAIMLVFGLCMIGGSLLGLLDMRITAFLGIAYGAFIGYMLFFRTSADIGRTVMFMGWMWFVVCLIGGTMSGFVPQAGTALTADITDADTTINVTSTTGFRDSGIIVIGSERIAYAHTTATAFEGTFWRPLIRGTQSTEAAAHTEGAIVRMPESSLLNDALQYNIALLSDSSGLMAFVAWPLAMWNIITSFMFLPLAFLGTDMVILTFIWGIFALGLLVSFGVSMAGGRRV